MWRAKFMCYTRARNIGWHGDFLSLRPVELVMI